MKNYTKILDSITTTSLALAIASSFFIFKNLHIGAIQIPQLFYLFLTIGIITTSIKIKYSKETREILLNIIKNYGLYVGIFFFFIAINLAFYFLNFGMRQGLPLFSVDLGRVIAEILLSIIIILNLATNKDAYKWLTLAFFIPLTLSPLLIFNDIETVINILPNDFFSNYSLQAMQGNTTSLASWIIITFAFSVSFLFKKINDKKLIHIILFGLCTIITTSLIWWTNSRGALFASIIIFLIIGFIHYKKQKGKLALVLLSLVLLLSISLYILPSQAKVSIFVRYYPQYRQEVTSNNFEIESLKKIISKYKQTEIEKIPFETPDFTNAQDRQNFWPKHILYIANHPLGIYGPEIISIPEINNLKEGEHNTILQAGKWGGWVGMMILVLFLYLIFIISINLIKKYKETPYIIGLIMAFFGVFSLAMLNSFINLKTFWILPGMIIAFYIQKENYFNLNIIFKFVNKIKNNMIGIFNKIKSSTD